MTENNLEVASLSGADEIDLTDAGIQEKDVTLRIDDYQKEQKTNGEQHAITFTSSDIDFPVTERFWYTHSNSKAQDIGRSNLKKIAIAATGSPRFSPASLLGRTVKARLYDREGFAALKNFQPVE